MSRSSMAMAAGALALLILGGVAIYSSGYRSGQRIIVARDAKTIAVYPAPQYAHQLATASRPAPVVVSSGESHTATGTGTAVAPLLAGPGVPGGITAPTSVPNYSIIDDNGVALSLEELRDNPRPVTLYLQRGDSSVPFRLDTNASAVIADQVAAAGTGAGTSAGVSSPSALESALAQTSTPTATESAVAETSTPSATESAVGLRSAPSAMETAAGSREVIGESSSTSRSLLPPTLDIYGSSGMSSPMLLPTGVPGVFDVAGFGRRAPLSYVQTFDVNGNLGWYRMNFSRSSGMWTPYSLGYTSPVAPEQMFAGSRAESSLAGDRMQSGADASQRANQSDAAARSAVTVR